MIGENRFGYVWKAKFKESGTLYAVRQMRKTEIIKQRCLHSIKTEKEIMARIRHPFISNIYFAFQDRDHLYLATEFAPRGDLDYFLKKRKKFKED